jgi:hypothetical protein
VLKIVDAATKVFLDKVIIIETYGNASAQHAMDFDATVPTAVENRAEMDSNSTQLAAIVADTNELQTDDIPGTLATILADTNELQTDLTDGGRLDLLIDAILADTGTTLPATLATIAGYLDTEIAAILEDTGTTIPGLIAALNDLSAAQVNAEVDAAIETYHLDHLLAVAYDPASKPGAADALLNELIENDAGVSRYTANALEQAPTGGSAPTVEEIRTEMDTNSTQLAAIVADTNELQTDWANGGRLDLIIDAILADTAKLIGAHITLSGTASAGSSTTITLTGGVATNGYYDGQYVTITSGTGAGQSRTILSYVGATTVATVTRDWANAPDATSVFSVMSADVPAILEAGTAQAGGVATITLDANASAINDTYKNNFIMITGGTGIGQTRLIGAYVGATKVVTIIPNWTTPPDATSVYQILPAARVDVGGWAGTLAVSTLFDGITSLAEWLGAMAGKQAADATALTEIQATGAGGGTYDEATDSQEAIRDRGDAAWVTGGDATAANQTTIINNLATVDSIVDSILADTADMQPKIGTPVALDAGAATLAAMLVKMADDNNGADFDAGTDSLAKNREYLGTYLPTIYTDTDELQIALTDGGRLDLLIDAILTDTGTTLPATLATIAGYLDTEIAAILEDTGTTIPGLIAALNNLSAAQVNAEVKGVIETDTHAEPSSVPSFPMSLKTALVWGTAKLLHKAILTKSTGVESLKKADGSTEVGTATHSNDDTATTKGAWS